MRTQKAAICHPGREVSPEMKLTDIFKLDERLMENHMDEIFNCTEPWGKFYRN